MFGIVQGGLDPELRAASTRFIAGLPFDGLCIGGLAGDETPEQRDAALDVAVPLLADDPRPRYLMGLGSPADLLEAVHRGVDLFDSVLPGAGGTERPAVGAGRPAEHAQPRVPRRSDAGPGRTVRACCAGDSRGPIWPICSGPRSCSAYRLATCHNLTFTLDFMARIRASIRAGTFPADDVRTALARGPDERR